MFKIGEFSKLTQVSIRMLRYYDETGLLVPARVNKTTGYRMYTSAQIETLNRILFLKEIGLNVSQIHVLLHSWSREHMEQELYRREKECLKNIEREQEKLLRIKTALSDLGQNNLDQNVSIVIKEIPAYSVLSLRRRVPDYFSEGELWKELTEFVEKNIPAGLELNKTFTIYHETEGMETEVDMELCVVRETGKEIQLREDGICICRETEAIEKAASFMVYGPYENIAAAYQNFACWLEEHPEYHMMGQSRQICHKGYWNETDPRDFVTELQVPLEIIFSS